MIGRPVNKKQTDNLALRIGLNIRVCEYRCIKYILLTAPQHFYLNSTIVFEWLGFQYYFKKMKIIDLK